MQMLDPDAVRDGLDERWVDLQVVAQTGSTNDDLLGAAAGGAGTGIVRVAEFQTAGRGRLSRRWDAPAGSSLMFSVLLRPASPFATWGWVPLLAGLGIHDALRTHTDAVLKWPNDVQIGPDRRKCGGILTQAANDAVVVGIGLNVAAYDQLPEGAAAIGEQWDAPREEILSSVLNALAARYRSWEEADGDAVRAGLLDGYRSACATLDQQVRVQLPGREEPVEGRAESVDDQGRLVVNRAGDRLVVGAGDVVHVRPA